MCNLSFGILQNVFPSKSVSEMALKIWTFKNNMKNSITGLS